MLHSFDYELEKMDGFETDYVKILYYDLPKNYSGDYKSYHYPRFCTILNGQKHVTLNAKEKFMYTKENFLLLAPHTKVHMDIYENTKALVFEINDDLVNEVLKKIALPEEAKDKIKTTDPYFLGNNKYNILEDIHHILDASNSHNANREFLIDLYGQKLIFDLLQNKATYSILNFDDSNPISQAIYYIDHHISSKINLEELAFDLNMSLSNFSHLFKKTTGIRPIDYIKEKKLELAVSYLQQDTVTEVALNLGYENISYFIKLFKEKYKVTPKQYKLTYYNN